MTRNLVPSNGGKQLTQFDPERHRLKVAALNYGIEEAKRIKQWPELEKAVDGKIEQQHAFVAWWGNAVRRPGGDQKSKLRTSNNDRGRQ